MDTNLPDYEHLNRVLCAAEKQLKQMKADYAACCSMSELRLDSLNKRYDAIVALHESIAHMRLFEG